MMSYTKARNLLMRKNGRYLALFAIIISSIVLLRQLKDIRLVLIDIPRASGKDFALNQINTGVLKSSMPEDYRIPIDDKLAQMNASELKQIYWKYTNMLQVLCKNVIRVGSLKDGGKEICIDNDFKPKPPCIVYSFGIGYKYDFDNAIVDLFGCNVYCFDPSMNVSTHQISDHMWFYNVGLGGKNFRGNNNWEIKTLDTIRQELGHTHRTIDVLKIDIEGDEWYTLLQMISSGALSGVQQIAIEVHFNPKTKKRVTPYKKLSALRQLYDYGFRIFMRERNIHVPQQTWPGIYGKVSAITEVSMIKVNS